jgi:7-cyano-7-deazaguanine reductase
MFTAGRRARSEDRGIRRKTPYASPPFSLVSNRESAVLLEFSHMSSSTLETFPNPRPERDFEIAISCPEFTSLCPKTGLPDFGEIRITYVPDAQCVELKSLKYYMIEFRNRGIFYESVTNQILDDLVALLKPRRMTVVGDFSVRGGIKTVVTAEYRQP